MMWRRCTGRKLPDCASLRLCFFAWLVVSFFDPREDFILVREAGVGLPLRVQPRRFTVESQQGAGVMPPFFGFRFVICFWHVCNSGYGFLFSVRGSRGGSTRRVLGPHRVLKTLVRVPIDQGHYLALHTHDRSIGRYVDLD